jgi:DNA modification methylase
VFKKVIPGKLKHLYFTSNEGDTIFDPFMEVASTDAAVLNLSRKFIGIELEELYLQVS